jgi:hypothetical protein
VSELKSAKKEVKNTGVTSHAIFAKIETSQTGTGVEG